MKFFHQYFVQAGTIPVVLCFYSPILWGGGLGGWGEWGLLNCSEGWFEKKKHWTLGSGTGFIQ